MRFNLQSLPSVRLESITYDKAIMLQKGSANTLMYFIITTFNYPTMAEAYRVAAQNGFNRLF
jgi:NAD(P) transhydrogenase